MLYYSEEKSYSINLTSYLKSLKFSSKDGVREKDIV